MKPVTDIRSLDDGADAHTEAEIPADAVAFLDRLFIEETVENPIDLTDDQERKGYAFRKGLDIDAAQSLKDKRDEAERKLQALIEEARTLAAQNISDPKGIKERLAALSRINKDAAQIRTALVHMPTASEIDEKLAASVEFESMCDAAIQTLTRVNRQYDQAFRNLTDVRVYALKLEDSIRTARSEFSESGAVEADGITAALHDIETTMSELEASLTDATTQGAEIVMDFDAIGTEAFESDIETRFSAVQKSESIRNAIAALQKLLEAQEEKMKLAHALVGRSYTRRSQLVRQGEEQDAGEVLLAVRPDVLTTPGTETGIAIPAELLEEVQQFAPPLRMPQLPSIGTIAELEASGGTLTPAVAAQLEALSVSVPLLGLKGLTPAELEQVSGEIEALGSTRGEMTGRQLVDLAQGILRSPEGIGSRTLEAAREVVKRAERSPDRPYKPQDETLLFLAQGVLKTSNLLSRNLDPSLTDPSGKLAKLRDADGELMCASIVRGESPEGVMRSVLALIPLQNIYIRNRVPQAIETYGPFVDSIIQTYAEISLKLRGTQRPLTSIIGTQDVYRLRGGIEFLKSVRSQMALRRTYTPKQHEAVRNVAQEVHGMLTSLALTASRDEELAGIFIAPIQRGPQDIDMAQSELLFRLNDKDATSRRTGARILASGALPFNFQVINDLLLRLGAVPKVTHEETGVSVGVDGKKSFLEHSDIAQPVLTKLLAGGKDQLEVTRGEQLAAVQNEGQKWVINQFFDILSQYLCQTQTVEAQ